MYEIVLFSGGLYRFNELAESVEDLGGLVLREDRFQMIRGASYLSEEIQVMIIIPKNDLNSVKVISENIKGSISKLDLDDNQKKIILTYLSIYNILNKDNTWMTIDEIKDSLECPCPAELCKYSKHESCVHDALNESLDKLKLQKMIKSRKENVKIKYQLNTGK